jgi:hypothetical protein
MVARTKTYEVRVYLTDDYVTVTTAQVISGQVVGFGSMLRGKPTPEDVELTVRAAGEQLRKWIVGDLDT